MPNSRKLGHSTKRFGNINNFHFTKIVLSHCFKRPKSTATFNLSNSLKTTTVSKLSESQDYGAQNSIIDFTFIYTRYSIRIQIVHTAVTNIK